MANHSFVILFFADGLNSVKSLHTLDLSHNQLITTRGLSDTPSLQCLDVSANHLQSVDDLDDLALLQTLRASGNNLMQVHLVKLSSRLKMYCKQSNLYLSPEFYECGLKLHVHLWRCRNAIVLWLQVPKLTNHVLLQRLILNDNSISFLSSLTQSWLPLLSHLSLSHNRCSFGICPMYFVNVIMKPIGTCTCKCFDEEVCGTLSQTMVI